MGVKAPVHVVEQCIFLEICFRSSQSEPWNIDNNKPCSRTATASQRVKNALGAVKATPCMTSRMQNKGEAIWREKVCFDGRE